MKLLTDIIAKKVLNLSSGQIEGTIKNACFDKNFKKIENFKMFDNDDEEYLLNTKKIYAIGQNAVVIKNKEAMILAINENDCSDFSTMNMSVYTADGNKIGRVTDLELTDNFRLKHLVVGDERLSPENIISIGEVVVAKGTSPVKLLAKSRTNPFKKPTDKIQTVTILAPKIESETSSPSTPARAVASPNFLLGRKATKTIYGMNNEIIIRKESAVTAVTLESAKRHGKLTELTVFSRSN